MRAPARIVFSCEHGGNQIPVECAAQFSTPRAKQLLHSHRGWDPGALEAAQSLATQAGQPLIASTITRLAVDLNRSLDHPNVHSEIVSQMSQRQRDRLVRHYYAPYRKELAKRLQEAVQAKHFVLHLSIHTFTPRLRGVLRDFEIGLLFDPARTNESWICSRWQQHLTQLSPRLRVEMNRPYLGIDDGLTTAMRAQFADRQYAGIELEINSRLRRRTSAGRQRLWQTLYETLKMTLTELPAKTA
jgi:predicted N-formylglutamate amidohydrolase